MKQRNTGLHIGKHREKPNFKTNLAVMVLPAALIFCALAGLLTTVTGLTAILPLFASSLIFLALFTLAKHFRKEAILLPAALVILIVIVIFARATLLNGFAALWNETRDLWANGPRRRYARPRSGRGTRSANRRAGTPCTTAASAMCAQ